MIIQPFREPVQLHNHSANSMLDAIPFTKDWVKWGLENKVPAISITDHGNVISFFDTLKTKSIIRTINDKNKTDYKEDSFHLIPGIEAYLKLNEGDKGHHHITMWATSNEGYFNLQKLSSEAFNDTVNYFGNTKARINFELIKKYKKGLKFGTGCLASIMGSAIADDEDPKLAEERYLFLKDLLGDDLFVEFHLSNVTHEYDQKTGQFNPNPHTICCPDGNKQKAYNLFLWDMLKKHGGKAIPVTDAHFINKEQHLVQTTVLKAGNSNGWHFHESCEAHTATSMFSRLQDHLGENLTPEIFTSWIDNTYQVLEEAKNINIKFDYHLPLIQVPEAIKAFTPVYSEQLNLVLKAKIKEHGRWRDEPEYVARYEKELDVICKNETLNFLPYFLVYEDIGTFLRSAGGLQGIARGSAGGSLLSYYLKIIHVDPIAKMLPFERFLSHARIRAGSFPDIDLDIQDNFRSVVVAYLKEKYGNGFAQIATFNKIKTKNAIKDAMFALYGKLRTDPEVMSVCEEIPDSPQGVDEYQFLYGFTDKEENYNAGLIEINAHVRGFFQRYPDIENMVKELIGLPRGWSRHASAFVISSLDLAAERVPTMVMKAKKKDSKEQLDVLVTQYDAAMVEKSGLVKADILGVRTLAVVKDCVKSIKERHGIDFLEENNYGVSLLYRLPEDKAIYADFYKAKTDSSFQFNTPLIKRFLPEFCPLSREDLSAMTALCRPGALDYEVEPGTSAAQLYMDVKNGKRDELYIHDDLKPILKSTYSAAVYQEQIMRILVEIGGFSWEDADIIRGAIGKKKKDVIQNTFTKIREATLARGWTPEQGDQLCKMIEAFSRYSFNLSHSNAYAELGYVTMYLKHHYPIEWWCSVLNHEPEEDKRRHFAALLHGIIKPPSLLNPSKMFVISGNSIVTPMWALKGIGPNASAELSSHGSFSSFEDFMAKIKHRKLNIGSMGALLKGRACDVLMDPNKPYAEARKEFMQKYLDMRKNKTGFPKELVEADELDLFLMERQVNQMFGKSLLSIPALRDQIGAAWPGLVPTGKNGIPFKMRDVPVLANVRVAEGFVDSNYQEEVAMILLIESSEVRRGISKKSGKPWVNLSIKANDGYQEVEIVKWRETQPLKWPVNSIFYVRGELRKGFKTSISINAQELERIDI